MIKIFKEMIEDKFMQGWLMAWAQVFAMVLFILVLKALGNS